MASRRLSVQLLIWILVLDTFVLGLVPQDAAALVAPLTAGDESVRVADLKKVQAVVGSKLVQQRLADFGLTAEEVNARVADLSDADLHQLAMNLDGLMPGGSFGLGFLVAMVIVLLVIVVIYLAGYRLDIRRERP